MQQYPFMPRCYHRVKEDVLDARLNDMVMVKKDVWGQTGFDTAICGQVNIRAYFAGLTNKANIYAAWTGGVATRMGLDVQTSVSPPTAETHINVAAPDTCLYVSKQIAANPIAATGADFWANFDIFNRKRLIAEELPKSNIPVSLQGMMTELF